MAASILVLAAHPQLRQSRINRQMMQAAAQTAGVVVRDLYALYPDYLVDVASEQAALADAQLVVWQHPLYWYGMPPLMKLWVDEVLAFGWAYGPGGNALHGKDVWLATSTGGDAQAYRPDGHNRYFFDAFLPPYEQTASLCGLRFLPPLVLHGAHRTSDDELAAHTQTYQQRLASYPDWPEIDDCPACVVRDVPLEDRPATPTGGSA
jgi:glutathione-regulated potassium-efflux system ancillary protein KefF